MDIKEAERTDAAAPTDADTATIGGSVARRRVLAAGISGTALSLLPLLGGRANAAGRNNPSTATTVPTTGSDGSTVTTTGATEEATTTTAPPKRPTDDDIVLLSLAQSVELTIRNLYDVAIGAGTFKDATLKAVKAIREAHEAYAQSLSGLLGRVAPNTPIDELFTSLQQDFSGSESAVATAARALENTAVATHSDIVGQLLGIDGSALVASMLIVEARHATYLATIAGAKTLEDEITGDAEPLSLSDYTAK